MNQIDYFFLDLGLSWSSAKAIPYIISIILGLLLFYFLKKVKLKKKWLKVTIRFTALLTPFIIYFSIFPIYEGDFTNQGTRPKSSILFPQSKSLTVVVLPNCPYCYQSIIWMKKIKERNPHIPINYWVSTQDTLSSNTAILKVLPKEFKAIQHHDTEKISELVQGTYPCFVISDKGYVVKLWNNNQIGVSSMDEIENFFSN